MWNYRRICTHSHPPHGHVLVCCIGMCTCDAGTHTHTPHTFDCNHQRWKAKVVNPPRLRTLMKIANVCASAANGSTPHTHTRAHKASISEVRTPTQWNCSIFPLVSFCSHKPRGRNKSAYNSIHLRCCMRLAFSDRQLLLQVHCSRTIGINHLNSEPRRVEYVSIGMMGSIRGRVPGV